MRGAPASEICCATEASFTKAPATELTLRVALPKPSPWVSQAHAGLFSTTCLLHDVRAEGRAWMKRYKEKKTAAEVSNIYARVPGLSTPTL